MKCISSTQSPNLYRTLLLAVTVSFGVLLAATGLTHGQDVLTIAGGGIGDGNAPTNASLNVPAGVVANAAGDLFITDSNNNRIRLVSGGTISTIAGDGKSGYSGDDGQATDARVSFPSGIAIDGAGNAYFADRSNGRIRKIDTAGVVTTVAGDGGFSFGGDGGPATAATLNQPEDVFVDGAGNLFIADTQNGRIRKVDTSGIITTIAGNGSFGFGGDGGAATAASLNRPRAVYVDAAGDVYIADTDNRRVRVVSGGVITTFAGNGNFSPPNDGGPATDAALHPYDIAQDATGNILIADRGSSRIRSIDSAGNISSIAGNQFFQFSGDGGPATDASLSGPVGLFVKATGEVLIVSQGSGRVREIDLSGNINTVAGGSVIDGPVATEGTLNDAEDVVLDASGNVYIADRGNNRVRKVTPGGAISTYAGGGPGPTTDGVQATDTAVSGPNGLHMDAAGNLYLTDSNLRVRKIDTSGLISTVAGGGSSSGDDVPATDVSLNSPVGVHVDGSGNIFFAETFSHRVRRVDAGTGLISTVAGTGLSGFSGDGAQATDADLNQPRDVFVDASGGIYIADDANRRVRYVDPAGVITTVAGDGTGGSFQDVGDGRPATESQLDSPEAVFLDAAGNLFIGDTNRLRVRRVDAETGIITTVAGSGFRGFEGDGGPATEALFSAPAGVYVTTGGDLYIADDSNHRIRKVAATPNVFALSLAPSVITANGGPGVLTAEIRDRSGVLQSGDNSTFVAFSVIGGTGSLSSSGSFVTGGIATVDVRSTVPGDVVVQVTADQVEADVAVASAVAATQLVELSSDLDIINDDGSTVATLTARLTDLGGVLQSGDNTTVISFAIEDNVVSGGEGSLSATDVTVSGGIATAILTGTAPGILNVEASTAGAESGRHAVTVKQATGGGSVPLPPSAGPGDITTFAGGYIGDSGPATLGALNHPNGVSVDGGGNVYIADVSNHRVRVVSGGTITTFAGGGSAFPASGLQAADIRMFNPHGVHASGGDVYVADSGQSLVYKVDASGTVTLIAGGGPFGTSGQDGIATDIQLQFPTSVYAQGGDVYFVEQQGHRVRRVDTGGTLTTIGGTGFQGFNGDGPATSSHLAWPSELVVDASGDVYVTDSNNRRIRKISSGTMTTIAGDGSFGSPSPGSPALSSSVGNVKGIALNAAGEIVFTDGSSNVFRIDAGGILREVAGGASGFGGDGGDAGNASFNNLRALAYDGSGHLYLADSNNHRIRRVDGTSNTVSTFAGGGIGDGNAAEQAALILQSYGQRIFVDWAGMVYIADTGHHRIRRIDTNGIVTTIAGTGTPAFTGDGGAATDADLNAPQGVFVTMEGAVYIADTNNRRIRKIDPSGFINTVAGSNNFSGTGDGGPATDGVLNDPKDVAVDATGNIYIAEGSGHRVRRVDPDGTISTFAGTGSGSYSGDGGPASNAALNRPAAVALDGAGNVYIADTQNNRVRVVDTSGNITTVAGDGSSFGSFGDVGDSGPALEAVVSSPGGVFVDTDGNLYIGDTNNQRVRKVDAATGIITTVAGSGSFGTAGDGGPATQASLGRPHGVTFDETGNLLIADSDNNRVRVVVPFDNVISISSSTPELTAGGSGAVLTAEMRDRQGALQTGDNATVVTFMLADGDGTFTDIDVQVSGGVATTTLFGNSSGSLIAGATASNADADFVALSVVEATTQVALSAAPANLPDDGVTASTLTAELQDLSGNVLTTDNSTVIQFQILPNDLTGGVGVLSASSATVVNGVATTSLTGSVAGIVTVEASATGALAGNVTLSIKATDGGGSPPPPITIGPGDIGTVAGGYNGDGGPALNASVYRPSGLFLSGGELYIAEQQGHSVRKVDAAGNITTVAGTGRGTGDGGDGGPATDALVRGPNGVYVAANGDVYVAEGGGGRIRKIDAITGSISTIAGGGFSFQDGVSATDTWLNNPYGVHVDESTGDLYLADQWHHRVRKVDGATGIITTVAGDGNQAFTGDGPDATLVSLNRPQGLWLEGTSLYIADTGNHRVRKLDTVTGAISTVAGNGNTWPPADGVPATSTIVSSPIDVFVDAGGSLLITEGNRVRSVDTGGIITTVAGTGSGNHAGDGGPATAAEFQQAGGVVADAAGNLFIGETWSDRVRRVDTSGIINTFAGGGIGDGQDGLMASLNRPEALFVDWAGNLLIADSEQGRLRMLSRSGTMATVAGGGNAPWPDYGDGGPASQSRLNYPRGVAMDTQGNIFVSESGNARVRRIDVFGNISTYAGSTWGYSGDGAPATSAEMNRPTGLALDGSGNLFVADNGNHAIRLIDASTGVIATIAGGNGSGFSGDGGPATAATLSSPEGVAVDNAGNVYIPDTFNHRVRKVDAATGIISTFAGGGSAGWPDYGDGGPATDAQLNAPVGVTIDGGGRIYIVERNNQRIRRVRTDGTIESVSGTGSYSFSGDGGPASNAGLASPSGIFADEEGFLFVADTENKRVRKISLTTPPVPTPTGDDVVVAPTDETGEAPLSMTFPNVSEAGETSLTTLEDPPALPGGFQVADEPIFFDLSTTAVFAGVVEVCYDYGSSGIVDDSMLRMLHYEGGMWDDVTSSLDTVNDILCGQVTSLSPFAIVESTEPIAPPIAALVGLDKVTIDKNANVTADIASNGDVKIKKGDKHEPGLIDGSITAGDDVDIDKNNVVTGDVVAGDKVKLSSNVVVGGTVEEGAAVDPLTLPAVALSVDVDGLSKIKVKKNKSLDLAPNDDATPGYGKLTVNRGATLNLRSGTYYFKSFDLDKNVSLVLDAGDGPITVNVKGKLTIGDGSEVTTVDGDASDVLFNVASTDASGAGSDDDEDDDGDDDSEDDDDDDDDDDDEEEDNGGGESVKIEKDARFVGTIYAPGSKIDVKKDVTIEGALIGRKVDLDKDVTFTGIVAGHLDVSANAILAKPALASDNVDSAPVAFSLGQNYPNPFNPATTIRYTLPEQANVRLVIYNVLGQEVRTLVNELQSPGAYSVVWNGTDHVGRFVASGIYFYRIDAGVFDTTRRMLFAK